jgi:hypothetical protein
VDPAERPKVQTDEPSACAAAACIALTWKYRGLILYFRRYTVGSGVGTSVRDVVIG